MKVCGVSIDNLTSRQIKERIESFLNDKKQHYIVLPYSLFLLQAQRDEEFRNILNGASLSVADGFGPVLAAKILKGKKLTRLTGIKMIELICEIAKRGRQKVFLFGSKKFVAPKAARVLKRKFKSIKIVGSCSGFYDEDLARKVINALAPDILLVGLGAPRQEKWIRKNLAQMPSVKIAVGVGGAFDFISGNIRRAPRWMRKIGLEWFWRVIIQPWRIGRVLKATFGLVWLILEYKFWFFRHARLDRVSKRNIE